MTRFPFLLVYFGELVLLHDEPRAMSLPGELIHMRLHFIHMSRPPTGQYFGELALLRNEPRAATVRAMADGVVLLELGRPHFLQLLGGDGAVMQVGRGCGLAVGHVA